MRNRNPGRSVRGTMVRSALAVVTSPTGLASSGFALICGAIAGNALFLQSARHPAPMFATRESPEAAPEQGDLIVQTVQQALRDHGYYDGSVDGVAGPRTRAAISAFERVAGRQQTGEATPDVIAAILESTAGQRMPGPAAATAASDPQVQAVQEALSRAAYGPLRADGVFGDATRDAITRFQLDQGLPLTGAIDDELVIRLGEIGAMDGI